VRILVANKFWYRRAGLERVMFDEIGWLEAAGHEVAHFSTQHPENDASPWAGYFAPYLELGPQTPLTAREKAIAVERMFWNRVAAQRFARLLRDFRPDIVHVHGIHRQISPSILAEARRAGVPVVQTLHDYHPICASGDLLLAGRCACDPPLCGPVNVLPCVVHACVHQSKTKSVLGAVELLWRRWMVRYEQLVDAFISPSRYLARIVSVSGVRHRPIHVLPNAIPAPSHMPDELPGEAFVYAGRLSREKGLGTLMRAVEAAHVTLLVAGTGPLEHPLTAQAPRGVRFLGRLPGDEVDCLLAGCRAAVVPSEWAENAPMAVLEPMALGRPVIATRMGGIPEQIRDGVDGVLVDAGDELQLAAALRVLADDAALADRLGRSAHDRATTTFGPQAHLDGLLGIYSAAIHTARQVDGGQACA
jgi:glycosyltransferase involved in cell wall biosynthesis